MARRCARKVERICCAFATYLPLAFVYGLTTWALWVIIAIGHVLPQSTWIGSFSSAFGFILYLLLNWCYTTAVFTNPGSTTSKGGSGILPISQSCPATTSFTVKSNGKTRFCKKCEAMKPDRAHHCSTCRRCVLKMDHHCPWLATCIGLRNHKAFLLFLVYTTFFSFYAFAISASWVWREVVEEAPHYTDAIMPMNFIILSVISGIIGLVVGAFTAWHILLASRGQTTIECLEQTRYLSPLRRAYDRSHDPRHRMPPAAQHLVDIHTNALPGITRPEEGMEPIQADAFLGFEQGAASTAARHQSYEDLERQQSQQRYEDYLDEQDSEKLPNDFDLGWRRNMLHLLGRSPVLWFLPICNTTGDGWSWEPSPRWLEAVDRVRREREQQRAREVHAGWGPGGDESFVPSSVRGSSRVQTQAGSPSERLVDNGRMTPNKADRVLGRDPSMYTDAAQGFPMQHLSARGRMLQERSNGIDDEEEEEQPEETSEQVSLLARGGSATGLSPSRAEAEQRALDVVTNGRAWSRGGASGMLRKGSSGPLNGHSSRTAATTLDYGVD